MSELNMNLSVAKRLQNKRDGKGYANTIYTIEHGFYSRGGGETHKRPVIWFTNVEKIPWRFTGYADKVLTHIRHTGWFTDNFQNGTVRGIVVQLPARNGVEQFLAGFACTEFDTVCIIRDVYTDKDDAARAADSEAETYGETCREDDAKQSAEAEIDELKSQNKTLRTEIASLRAEKKKVAKCGHLLATGTLRDTIREKTAEIATNRTRIEALSDNYWVAVPA